MSLIFYDTEFLQNGSQKVTLVSIGMVTEDGRTLYCESSEWNDTDANDWVKANVLPKLGPREKRMPRAAIKDAILKFVGDDPSPTFVAYNASYDSVCLFELFGSFGALPEGWPNMTWDMKQDVIRLGRPELPAQEKKGDHNALSDAIWLKNTYWFLHGRFGLVIPATGKPKKAANEAISTYHGVLKRLGVKAMVEAIGDNTVDNLVTDLRRTVSVELSQFVAGLLNGSVGDFAYSIPQYAEFKKAIENLSVRFAMMDGLEQGDLLQKVIAMFKDIFASTYAACGPETADMMALKYAKQMVDWLKAQSPQMADLAASVQPKVY